MIEDVVQVQITRTVDDTTMRYSAKVPRQRVKDFIAVEECKPGRFRSSIHEMPKLQGALR